ncbi:MAG: cytochrome b [Tatlockia sp.]|nr:cytochrome b [Tatlockia sp.]
MLLKNTNNRYGIIAIALHWVIAAFMIGLTGLGIYMVSLPINLEKLKLYGWHKEYGFFLLLLVIIRLIWRLTNKTPVLSINAWEVLAARIVHWSFYGFMLTLPITGWLLTSAAGLPASFFGFITLPNLIAPDNQLMQVFQETHKWLGYVLIGFIICHTAAALKHHYIDKDNILMRIIFAQGKDK